MKSNEEVWKPIKNFENYYISNYGNVISKNYNSNHNKPKQLKQNTIDGYKCVKLSNGKKAKTFKVHRLVAEYFISNPSNLSEINHKDENRSNNIWTNLEWCTHEYNINYGNRTKKASLSNFKKVIQYDLNNKLIKIWNNISEPSKKYNTHHIGECCLGKRKTTGGYIWKYVNESEVE